MTRLQAVVLTVSMSVCAFLLFVIGAFAANPFGEPDPVGRLTAALCAFASIPTAGAGAFIAHKKRGGNAWLVTAAALSGAFLVYVVLTFPSELL